MEDDIPIIAKEHLWLNNVLFHYIWSAWRWSSGKLPALPFKFHMMTSQKSLWLILANVGANQNLFEIFWPTWGEARSLSKCFWPMWGKAGSLYERCGLHEVKSGVLVVLAPHKSGGGWGVRIVKSDMWHFAFTACVVSVGLRTFWSFCYFGIIQILSVIKV